MQSADTVVSVGRNHRPASYHPSHGILAGCLLLAVAASNRSLAGRDLVFRAQRLTQGTMHMCSNAHHDAGLFFLITYGVWGSVCVIWADSTAGHQASRILWGLAAAASGILAGVQLCLQAAFTFGDPDWSKNPQADAILQFIGFAQARSGFALALVRSLAGHEQNSSQMPAEPAKQQRSLLYTTDKLAPIVQQPNLHITCMHSTSDLGLAGKSKQHALSLHQLVLHQ